MLAIDIHNEIKTDGEERVEKIKQVGRRGKSLPQRGR